MANFLVENSNGENFFIVDPRSNGEMNLRLFNRNLILMEKLTFPFSV